MANVLRQLDSGDAKIAEKLAAEKSEEWQWAGDVNVSKKKSLLLIGKNRVYVHDRKKFQSCHLLELTEISSKTGDSVDLTFKTTKFQITSSKADEIIHQVRCAFHLTFSLLPEALKPKLDVSQARLQDLPSPASLPCGGYGTIYASVCDHLGVSCRNDIIWDISNVLAANSVTEFNIKEFEQPMRPDDQRSLLVSLGYTSYFESFVCKRFKLHKDAFVALAEAFALNRSIENLELRGVGAPRDGLIPTFTAITSNPNCALTSVSVAENEVSDDTLARLGAAIGSLKKGLILLDVSGCKTKNGVVGLVQGFTKNRHMPTTLVRLDLSDNVLGSPGAQSVAQWLANPNGLQILGLANTQANLDPILAALGRGSQELQQLDIQGNKINKGKEATSLVRFIQGAAKLKSLDISDTAIPADCLKEVIEAVTNNYYIQGLEIIARGNKFGAAGAALIGRAMAGNANIARLDLGENDFNDEGVTSFCKAVMSNTGLKHLGLGGNFSAATSRSRDPAIEALIDLISSECPLVSLDVRGSSRSQLKADISTLLYALGTDNSLEHIDISGNGFSDKGALSLSKALQTNRKLNSIVLDDNGITFDGFQSLAYGLKRNLTLKHMPLPIQDITSAMPKDSAARAVCEEIVREIERYVTRNQSPQGKFKGGTAVAKNTANMLLASAEREQLERLRFKIRANGRSLDAEETLIIEDAEANDSHIQSIHSIQEQHHLTASVDVVETMKSFVPQLVPVVERHQRQLVGEMMEFVKSRYQSIDEETLGRLQRNIQFMGKEMDVAAVEKVIVDAASTEINNRVQECMISAVDICTDYIYEKLADLLQNVLDEVRTAAAPADNDDEDSEYEDVEVEVTDSDEEQLEEDIGGGDVGDDEVQQTDSELTPSESTSTSEAVGMPELPPPPSDSETAPPPPIRGQPVPGAAGGPPPAPARPMRPPRGGPGVTQSEYPGIANIPPPIQPRGAGLPTGQPSPGLPGRGRAVGGGIAARLEAMGGGIPMPGMGMPPMRPPSTGLSAPPPGAAAPASPARLAPRPGTVGASVGGGGGAPSRPPAAASAAAAPAAAGGSPAKKTGLFGRAKADAPKKKVVVQRRKVNKAGPAGANRRAMAPVAKPSGQSDNIARVEEKESNIGVHMTKDRPMMKAGRRPPTRRPRNELL